MTLVHGCQRVHEPARWCQRGGRGASGGGRGPVEGNGVAVSWAPEEQGWGRRGVKAFRSGYGGGDSLVSWVGGWGGRGTGRPGPPPRTPPRSSPPPMGLS